ncbi:zinc finger protein 135 isoform X2 [Stomoxys calcitrans]|nr:zinc finger protein 135 isoform X2 [Stomoxys calcitrans]
MNANKSESNSSKARKCAFVDSMECSVEYNRPCNQFYQPTTFKPILPKTEHRRAHIEIDNSASRTSHSRLYKCLECAESFKSFKHLRQHEFGFCNIFNINGVFACKYCHLCFKAATSLANHESSQHPEQQFLCCLCEDKLFTSKGYLTRHIQKTHNHSFLQYFCGECDEAMIMTTKNDVKKHFESSHTGQKCSNEAPAHALENEDEGDMDLEMHEEFLDEFLLAHSNENSFQFSECWEALDLHLTDMLHAQTTHSHNGETHTQAFQCPKCFEPFQNPQPLLQHLAESHNISVFLCQICQQTFPTSNDFKLHKRSICSKSTSATCVNCPFCGKAFSSTLKLKQHLRIVHTQNKKHICQLCDKQFSTLDHLKKHVLSQHQNERKHICHICSKSFSQSCHLKQHLAIHTIGKTIKCTECPERFWRNIDLYRHRKQHVS